MTTADTLNTFLAALDAHPLLERLFFASAELAVLAVCVALAITALRIRSPRACAMLWLIVLAKPIVTLSFGAVVPVLRLAPPDPIIAAAPLPEAPPVHNEAMSQVSAPELLPAPLPAPPVKLTAAAVPARPPINWGALAPRILASLWLAGVVLLLGSTLLDRIRLRRFLARTAPPSAHASAALAEGAASLPLRTAPPLRVTTELESPAVVGWFRSTIVIPQWLNAPENETALAWALRHELTHLKHRDPIANALRRLAQVLFFFHPVTWWASRRWEAAVELACDRAVVRTDDDVTAYAEQLYAILVQARQQRQRTMATGLFATRTQINTRIAALLGNSLNTPARLGIAAVLSLVLFAGTVFAVGGAIADREESKEETAAEETEQSLPSPQNPALQAKCESLLEGHVGAIVVLNADTGAVLAMTSAPFGTMKEVIEGQKVSGNASLIRPAYTRAYQEQYPPGSTLKILLAAAALEEGVITPETTHFCGGSYRINGGGRAWGCWKRDGHGRVNVTDAMVYSCDVFFYNVGLSLGVDKINAWSRKFGLGISTGIDLPREISGLIPSQEWKKQIFADKTVSEQKWYPGDTLNLSIGQGSAAVTPLQNAVMMAAILNGGFRVMPRMNAELPPDRSQRMLSDATLEVLHAALRRTVEKAPPDYPAGTGWRAGIDGIDILGKTGSAQIMSAAKWSKYASDEEIPYEMRDHAWFVAGVMDREPKISVSVLLENGMHGGTGAAEIARAVIAEAYGIETSVREKTVVIDGETVTLTTPEDPIKVEVPAQLPARTLAFPDDRSMGTVWIGDPIDYTYTPDKQPEMNEAGGWKNLGDAKGAVEIPAGKAVWLDVGPKGEAVDLAPLATLPPGGVQYLDLYKLEIEDDALRHIAGLSGLEAVSLYRNNITDAGLAHLAALTNLRWLDLGATKIEGPGLGQLTACKELVHLDLNNIPLKGGPAAEQLGQLTSLQWLDLSSCEATGDDLKALAGLTDLVTLDLEYAPITNEDLAHLLPFKQLRHLSLEHTKIEAGYKDLLAELANLDTINVNYTAAPEAESRMTVLGGRVVNDEGAPVEGVKVELFGDYAESVGMQSGEATSATDGRWSVRLPGGWTRLMANLSHPDYISDRVLGIRPMPPESQLVDQSATFVMVKGTTFSGSVIDSAGKPVAGAYILHGYYHGELDKIGEDPEVTVADSDGRFTVGNLEKQRHDELTVFTMEHGPEVVRLDYNAPHQPLAVTLGEGTTVTGVVKDAQGTPLAGAEVSIREWRPNRQHSLPRESISDELGRFELRHAPDHGQLSLSIWKAGHYSGGLQKSLPFDAPLELTLIKEEPYRGKALDATTGKPISDIKVDVASRTGVEADWWLDSRFASVDQNPATGSFSVSTSWGLSAEHGIAFLARVRAKGYRVTEAAPLDAAKLGEEVEIRMEPAPAVEGIVNGPDGQPLEGAQIAWAREGEKAFLVNGAIDPQFVYSPDWFESSDAKGHFAFAADDKPGVLVATHDLGIAWLDLNGHEGPIELALAPWVRVEGRLHGVTGLTPISYEFDAPEVAGRKDFFSFVYASVNTDEAGNFVLDKLPPMPVTVGVLRRWEPSHGVTFNPKPGEVLKAEIGTAPQRVTGRFDLAKVAPLVIEGPDVLTDDRHLTARAVPRGTADPTKGLRYIPEIDKDGAFTITGIPAGDYTLHTNVHATPPHNACGRGTPIGSAALDFTVSDDTAEIDLGVVPVVRTNYPEANSQAPAIAAKLLGSDKAWSLADEKGKLVVLDFWATWCAPCVAAMPSLKAAYDQLPRDRVTMVGLNLDVDQKTPERFLQEKELPWKQVYIGSWAENNAVTLAYGVSYIPSLWIIDANGAVLARDVKPEELTKTVEALLQ